MTLKKIKHKKLDKKFKLPQNEKSDIALFREEWLKKGFELIDVTQLCIFKLGHSGSCNAFNEPDQEFYHIQCWYRDEQIAVFSGTLSYVTNDDTHLIWNCEDKELKESEFIIFRKVKM